MGSTLSCCTGSDKTEEEAMPATFGGVVHNSWRIFKYKELHAATNGFSEENKLGEGGFGSVYLGKTSDGLQIAVKKLKAMNSKAEMEFAVEVEVLGRVRHKNLLGLRGYCAGGADQRLIVYDYMPNLSLFSHLAGQVQLDWNRRFNIAIGSAEGLLYLHHEVTPHIIHRDIKASNVVLNSEFEPLVADFGFAKLIPEGVSHMLPMGGALWGTWRQNMLCWGRSLKTVTFIALGFFCLSLFLEGSPSRSFPNGLKRTIIKWAEPLISKGRFRDLVDPRLRGNNDENQVTRAINVAALCAH